MVASNLVFSRESAIDDPLEELYHKKLILPFTLIEKNGLKIGLFGLVGLDAESVAPASRPVTFSDPLKEAGKMASYLKEEQQADLVILLSHSGIYPDPQGNGYIGEDIELAAKVPQIDLIISGHTHVTTPDCIRIGSTCIVQTGSYAANLGKLQLKIENRKIVNCKFDLIPVDDAIAGDAAVSGEIDQQIHLIDRQYLAPAGLSYKQIIGRTDFNLVCRYTDQAGSNLGPFVADAVRHYTETTGNPADISLVAAGTIREDILKGTHGNLCVADLFRVMSLGMGYDSIPGYPLARFYLTAHEIKKLMEVLLISRNKGGDGFIYFSGVRVYANPEKGLLRKVQQVEINGKAISRSKKDTILYSLAANTYLLGFIGEIKKMSHGLVKLVPKDASGKPVADMKHQRIDADLSKPGIQEAKEWIALVNFIQGFEQKNNIPLIPDIYRQGDRAVIRVNHPL
jgi:5'-nucleotidase